MHPSTPPRPDLDGIEARANAASEGPWEILGCSGERHGLRGPRGYMEVDGYLEVMPSSIEIHGAPDTLFIAAARQDIPALVAYARSLEARVKLLGELAERLANGIAHMDQCQECGDGSASDCPWGGMEAMRALQAYNDSIPELNCHGGAV